MVAKSRLVLVGLVGASAALVAIYYSMGSSPSNKTKFMPSYQDQYQPSAKPKPSEEGSDQDIINSKIEGGGFNTEVEYQANSDEYKDETQPVHEDTKPNMSGQNSEKTELDLKYEGRVTDEENPDDYDPDELHEMDEDADVKEAENIAQNIKDEWVKLEAERAAFADEQKQMKEHIAAEKHRNEVSLKQLEHKARKLAEERARLSDDQKAKADSLRRNLDAERQKLEMEKEKLLTLQKKNEKELAEHQRHRQEIENIRNEQRQKFADLQQQHLQKEQEHKAREEQLQEARAKLDKEKQRVNQEKEQLAAEKSKLMKMQSETQLFVEKQENLDQERSSLEREKAKVEEEKRRLADAQNQLQDMEAEKAKIAEEHHNIADLKRRLDEEKARMEQQHSRESGAAQREVSEAKQRLDEERRKLQHLQQQLEVEKQKLQQQQKILGSSDESNTKGEGDPGGTEDADREKQEEERRQQEEQRRQQEEEEAQRKRKEEERQKQEQEQQKQEEVRKRQEEERRQQEETRKKEEERKRQEAERRRQEEEKRKQEEERQKQEEERRAKEEEQKRRQQHLANGQVPPEIMRKYPGLTMRPEYSFKEFANGRSISGMTDAEAEEIFYSFVTTNHIDCRRMERLGNSGDGGWNVCLTKPYDLNDPCTVYSYGINNDWSFDDSISRQYNCDVRAFDPSMGVGDHAHSRKVAFYNLGLGGQNTVDSHGWKIKTLGAIFEQCGDSEKDIDVLKIDIEYNEWASLQTALQEGSLKRVKQFVFEIHTPDVNADGARRHTYKADFLRMYNILLELEKAGFRKYHHHWNPFGNIVSPHTGKQRTCCYEMYYVNINYLT